MTRAPVVLAATVAGTAALLSFHPHRAATAAAARATAAGRTVTGAVEDTQYGRVQVRITVSGGRLADVQATQLPQNEQRSYEISTYAAPLLRTEALQARSAQIDVVSGATYTSQGYEASLASALQTAGL